MRDTTDQDAETFEPLRTKKLFLELFAFRDVSIENEERFGLALLITNQRDARLDGDRSIVLGKFLEFARPFTAFVQALSGFFYFRRQIAFKKQINELSFPDLFQRPS